MFFPGALAKDRFAPDLRRERNTNQAIARLITNANGMPMPSPTLAAVLGDDDELGVADADGDEVGVAVTIFVAVLMVVEIEVLVLEDVELVACDDCATIPKVGELNSIPNASPSASVPFTITNSNKVELL